MLRLIHNQTVTGAILVDDVDDGLPNKEVHRLGSLGDPNAYERDGYANKPKQGCYIPYSHTAPNGSAVAGYVTLQQTNKVTLSQGKGKIKKLAATPPAGLAGAVNFPLVTVVTGITAAQLAPATISAAASGPPTTVTGSAGTFVSVTPDVTTVTFGKGAGATLPVTAAIYGSGQTLTAAQIVAAGGSVASGAISIPAGAFAGGVAPIALNTVYVTSNEQNSNTFVMS